MLRLPVLLAAVLSVVLSDLAFAEIPPRRRQPPKGRPEAVQVPLSQFPDITFKDLKPADPKQGPTPEEVADYRKQFDPPPLPKVLDADPPLVKLAKAKLAAVTEAQWRLRGRVHTGINTSQEFGTYCELGASLTAAADDAFEKPADRVKWYEHRVLLAKMMERYYVARSNSGLPGEELMGVDPPYLFPLASVARLDAEIALLKLKATIGK